MEASTTPKSCMDFLLVLLKKSDDISEHGPWFTAQKVCKGHLECSIQCAIYICHRSSYSDSEPRMLPHSRFSVVIMVNPRSWSTLDGAVDYVPVLSAPCREIPLKIPGRYPRSVCTLLLFHSYSDTRHLKAKRCFHGIVKKRFGGHKPSFLSHSAGE